MDSSLPGSMLSMSILYESYVIPPMIASASGFSSPPRRSCQPSSMDYEQKIVELLLRRHTSLPVDEHIACLSPCKAENGLYSELPSLDHSPFMSIVLFDSLFAHKNSGSFLPERSMPGNSTQKGSRTTVYSHAIIGFL